MQKFIVRRAGNIAAMGRQLTTIGTIRIASAQSKKAVVPENMADTATFLAQFGLSPLPIVAPPSNGFGYKIATDLFETPDFIEVDMDIPGVKKTDIEITTNNLDQITVSVHKGSDGNLAREERFIGIASRTVFLPDHAIPNETIATYEDGVLRLKIPKSHQESEPKSTIEIQ
jgi:HSP20 family protein